MPLKLIPLGVIFAVLVGIKLSLIISSLKVLSLPERLAIPHFHNFTGMGGTSSAIMASSLS